MKEVTFPQPINENIECEGRGPFIQVIHLGHLERAQVLRNKGIWAIDINAQELVFLTEVEFVRLSERIYEITMSNGKPMRSRRIFVACKVYIEGIDRILYIIANQKVLQVT